MELTLNKKGSIVVLLLGIYIVVVCFGNLFRVGNEESAFGLSTLLIFLIFAFRVFNLPLTISSEKYYITTLMFLSLSLCGALFYPGPISTPLLGSLKMLAYLFSGAAVAGLLISHRGFNYLFWMMALGIGVSGFLTVIDYLNIVNIPGANSNEYSTEINGARVEQAAGFFSRRSAMAAFTSLVAPAVIVFALLDKSLLKKLILLALAACSLVALFLSHNRSGIIGIIASVSLFLIFSSGVSIGNKFKLITISVFIFVILISILMTYFPSHINVYLMKLGMMVPTQSEGYDESDYSRVYFFIAALQSLVDSPIGHGFAEMYTTKYGFTDPHNIFSHLLWSLGLFAFYLFPYTILKIQQTLRNTAYSVAHRRYAEAIKYGLAGWLINNMTHNSIGMGLFWLFVGLAFSLRMTAGAETHEEIEDTTPVHGSTLFNFARD